MQKVSLVASLAGHEDRVWCVAVSPDGSLIASCGGDKTIRIYSLRTHGCISVLEGSHSRTIRCVTWSPSGSHIAAASFDGTVSIWEKTGTTWSSSICLEGHENEVKCVTWHRNGSLLATCARDKTVWIWEATDDGDYECAGVLNGHTQDVKCVRWHPQEELLASCSYDDTVKIWGGDGDDWSCLNTLKGHTGTVWQCSFDPTGCALASCCDDFSVRIWTRAKGAAKHNYIPSHCISGIASQPLYSLHWSDTGIAVATGDNSLVVLELEEAGWVVKWRQNSAHALDVNSVEWAGQHTLVTAGDDERVNIWQLHL